MNRLVETSSYFVCFHLMSHDLFQMMLREREREKRNYLLSRFCYFEFVLERIFYKQ